MGFRQPTDQNTDDSRLLLLCYTRSHQNAVSGPNPSGESTTSPIAGAPTTPTIDELASEGCKLEMYCASRPRVLSQQQLVHANWAKTHVLVSPELTWPGLSAQMSSRYALRHAAQS